ncbi:DUF5606 family protein [Mucilaginibacter ginkgonis]|uniref:DUF5606 domain-containing protein n=1 Tax=Mucilaginibacter ginkgonis TaxID=2682091 RepID=A0A6I4HX46_9SPHI|nr:DUF5606 domain-containing protein [Mucilaginibacter ginkgonis]QQL51339.1 DUF5606 domain-containing protein [Mucilaginibacter ginkgonis]
MNIHGIVAVSGKPGLWRAIAQNKTGFVLESLDAAKTKLVVNTATAKLAALDEITIFGNEDDIKLTDVLEKMKSTTDIPDPKADGNKLRAYFYEVAPDHDESRVYSSDIKKVISWFGILKDHPGFNEAANDDAPVAAEEPAVEIPAEKIAEPAAAEAKPKAKKAAAKK